MIHVNAIQYTDGAAIVASAQATRSKLMNPFNAKIEVDQSRLSVAKALELVTKERNSILSKYNEQLSINEKLAAKLREEKANVARLNGKVLELKSNLGSIIEDECNKAVIRKTPKLKAQILKWCEDNNVPYDYMIGKSRVKEALEMRSRCIYDLFKANHPWRSYTEIGRAFGDRDHTTIMACVRKMKAREGDAS